MLRTILSYSVLVLIPAVSLAIAVAPYWWVKRRRDSPRSSSVIARQPKPASPTSQGGQSRFARVTEIAASSLDNLGTPRNDISWKHLWLAFGVGLAGNVAWWWVIFELPSKISSFIHEVELSGFLFGLLFYAIFIALLPFIFFRLKYHRLNVKQIIYCIILSLLVLSLEIGGGIILFFIGWNRLFYAFN